MTPRPIYLDYNATTPIDPALADAVGPFLKSHFGNPSSTHAFGVVAHQAVETARAQVAALINAEPDEIVFTGGGSEATNLALKGVCLRAAKTYLEGKPLRSRWLRWFNWGEQHVPGRCTVVTTAVEHPATATAVEYLRCLGVRVHVVPVDRLGVVDPDKIRRAVRWGSGAARNTIVSVMHSNNETGTLMPVAEVGAICRKLGVVFHTDAAQSLGKVPVDVKALQVDLLTIAGHKLYAPKGVGALYVRRGVKLEPLVHGAGQEGGRRAGTENVPYIVGLGKAAELARESLPAATARLALLRDRLHAKLTAALGDKLSLNGHPELRLPNTLNVNFHGHNGPELLAKVPGIAASNGAACHETKHGTTFTPSAVLCAMRVPPEVSVGAVRLTVGRWTTEEEVDRAAELLIRACG